MSPVPPLPARGFLFTALALLVLLARPLAAQLPADRATLVIFRDGQAIGHEDLRIRPAPQGRAVGDSLVTTARYPDTHPDVELQFAQELRPAAAGFTLRINERTQDAARQIYSAMSGKRITLRVVAQTIESARELPGGPEFVVVEDSLFAPFLRVAALASDSAVRLTGFYPRSGRRVSFLAAPDTTPASFGDSPARRIILSGGLTGWIYLDQAGRLLRVLLPEAGLEAVRLPG